MHSPTVCVLAVVCTMHNEELWIVTESYGAFMERYGSVTENIYFVHR